MILEWHQDLFGRCAEAPGTALAYSANGAPNWACPPGFAPSTFGHLALFDRLWHNDDRLLDAFIAAWAQVIQAVGESPALLGYDVINEPQGTGGSPTVERDEVYPAYRKLVPALRSAGAEGLLFLDAPELRNESPKLYTEDLSDLGPGVVFAPHLYSAMDGALRLPPAGQCRHHGRRLRRRRGAGEARSTSRCGTASGA